MPRVDIELESAIARSPRVMQVEGLFDVPEQKTSRASYHFDVPFDDRPWSVGLIVGPSGAGKSTVARHLFGDALIDGYQWPHGKAIVDAFGKHSIDTVVGAPSSVGFASPPAWLKPFSVLSNGERFRVNLARAIVDERPLVAIDEFSSVIDRQVALVASHAVAKAVRAREGKKLVAVTCHGDVVDWLQPDWVLEPHVGTFSWRSPWRRPAVDVEIVRCSSGAWRWFRSHHYLSAELNRSAKCFVALVGGELAGFAAVLPTPHAVVRNLSRIHRMVVLPDFQGLGIGAHALPDAVGGIARAIGRRLTIVTSHPGLIMAMAKSRSWRLTRNMSIGTSAGRTSSLKWSIHSSAQRRTASFEYVGSASVDADVARKMWTAKVKERT